MHVQLSGLILEVSKKWEKALSLCEVLATAVPGGVYPHEESATEHCEHADRKSVV